MPGGPRSRRATLVLAATLAAALAPGCASSPSALRPEDADVRLDRLLRTYDARRAEGGTCLERLDPPTPQLDCERLRMEVETLAFEFPTHPRVLLANAVLSWNAGKVVRAQQYLDALLALEPASPDAAVLRARIAMQEGNLRLAERLLTEQARLRPDHADVRETLAAVLYLDDRPYEAAAELDAAERLGAPVWRIEYHRGLLAESQRRYPEAAEHYVRALELAPDFAPARNRLDGLGAR